MFNSIVVLDVYDDIFNMFVITIVFIKDTKLI